MTVTVYTRNSCGACVGTKAALERQGTAFTEVNIEEPGNEHFQQQLVDEGFRAMPVVKTDDDSWAGMNLMKIHSLRV